MGLFALSLANLIAFIVTLFIYESAQSAFIILGVGIVLIYLGVQFSLFSTRNFELHVAWYIADGIIILAIALALLISLS